MGDPTLGTDPGQPDALHSRHLRVAFAIYGVLLVIVLMVLSLLAQRDAIAPVGPLAPADDVTAWMVDATA